MRGRKRRGDADTGTDTDADADADTDTDTDTEPEPTSYSHTCGSGGETATYATTFAPTISTTTMPPAITLVYEYDPDYIAWYNDYYASYGLTAPVTVVSTDYVLDEDGHVTLSCYWQDISASLPDSFVGFPIHTATMWME